MKKKIVTSIIVSLFINCIVVVISLHMSTIKIEKELNKLDQAVQELDLKSANNFIQLNKRLGVLETYIKQL